MKNELESLIVKEEISNEEIKNLIYTIRGKQVMLDRDVAMLYHYQTKRINETVSRNKERFPENFCFQLTEEEVKNLKRQSAILKLNQENNWSQIATLNKNNTNYSLGSQFATLEENTGRGKNRKYLPYVFTEQGIAMLSGLLKNDNDIAIQVSINIMNSVVEMRRCFYGLLFYFPIIFFKCFKQYLVYPSTQQTSRIIRIEIMI